MAAFVPQLATAVAAELGGRAMAQGGLLPTRTTATAPDVQIPTRGETGASGMPTRGDSGARTVPTTGGVSRARGGGAILSGEPYVPPAPPVVPPGTFFPYRGQPGGSPFIGGPSIGSSTDPSIDTTNRSNSPGALYGTDSPFAILADAIARTFGSSEATPQTTYVPVTGSAGSGGGSAALVLILLAVAGAAYYFFVYRKRGANA